MLSHFPFSVDVQVRGYELDIYGHVNNAVYLNWLEHARWELAAAGGFSVWDSTVQPVVRAVELDYQSEARLGDRLRITLWPRRVGTTSFTFGNCVRIAGASDTQRVGRIALLASTTLVSVRRDGSGKAAVPDVWRAVFPHTDPGPQPPF